jgi:hypothetical protein
MSYSQQRPVKMHCKVCESAKMSSAIIASHFPKNKGVTVCPTLLAIQCRGCGKRGHTISYCKPTTLVAKETKKETKPKETKKETKPKTAYDSLYMSDDDDVATVVIQIQEPKKEKEKKEKSVGPAKKFCWATAESESSGSDEEEE